MRDLLQYPHVQTQQVVEIQQLLKDLQALLQQPYVLEENDIAFQDHEMQVYAQKTLTQLQGLIRKVVPLCLVQSMLQSYALDDLPMLLLQPKPPAVFDITLQEVLSVVTCIYQANMPTYERIYYKALLQNSLLLSDIDPYLTPTSQGMADDDCLKSIANRLYTEGKEGSEIITF